ncbi:MAG: ribokinase [Limisphaerales bacterium]
MKRGPSILVVGSSCTDMVIRVDRLPRVGETVLGGEFARTPGGKGANQAVGAVRAGGSVTFVGCIGLDEMGDKAVDGLKADGINMDYTVRTESAPSGVALIFVGPDGQNSIAVASGSNGKLTAADLKKSCKAFSDASVMLLQLETPLKTVESAAEIASESGARIILNPAPAQPLPASLLERLFLITPNEMEAELLTGVRVTDIGAAAKAAGILMAKGVKNVIITMGSAGAYVATKDINQMVPSFKVKAIDTVAAGDVFNGALAVALAEGKSMLESTRFANAAAAIAVTRPGAQASAPTRKEIEQMLATGKTRPIANVDEALSGNGHTDKADMESTVSSEAF